MEGAYNKVLGANQQLPDEFAAFYFDQLTATVRDEIASCSEKAYASLTLADAQKLMLFKSAKEAAAYAQQVGRGLGGGDWGRGERHQHLKCPRNTQPPNTHSQSLLPPPPIIETTARLGGQGRPRLVRRPRRRRVWRRGHGRRRRGRRGRGGWRRGRRRRRAGADPQHAHVRQGAGADRLMLL
jgi:hypothetical protein